jgi:hypothetical protein
MKKLSAILVVALFAGTSMAAFGPYQMAGGVLTENFDSMGYGNVVPNDGVATWYWNAVQNGATFSPGSLMQNGGSADPDWVNWGTPSVGAAACYNTGMEGVQDRALGIYKTGTSENPNYLECQVQLDQDAPNGLIVSFDVEAPMARYNAAALKGYTTNFDFYADGSLVGATTDLALNSMTNITNWSWSDPVAHHWLNDAQMVDGQECERDVAFILAGPYTAGQIVTLKWEVGVGATEQRMHTALDNLVVEVIPEPATMGLLAIGGIGALLRRRR